MVTQSANATRNSIFFFRNILVGEYIEGLGHTEHSGRATPTVGFGDILTLDGVRVHAGIAQLLQVAQAVLRLLATGHLRVLLGAHLLHLAQKNQLTLAQRAMLLPRATGGQIRQEALRHARRNRNVHKRQRRLASKVAGYPTRGELQVEAIQATQL